MNDLRYALRQLVKNPGFTGIALLSLAIGIGANTAIFGFVDRFLLRPLPVERPDRLVTLHTENVRGGPPGNSFNAPLYRDYRDGNEVLEGLAAVNNIALSLNAGAQTERVEGFIVSANYFSVLGLQPALGRLLVSADDDPTASEPVVVISHGLWKRRFGADPATIGRTVLVNNHRFTIVGICPPEFRGTTGGLAPDLYVPLGQHASVMSERVGNPLETRYFVWLQLLGRLKPGVTRDDAQASLRTLAAQVHRAAPENTDTNVVVLNGSQGHNGNLRSARTPLVLVQVTVGLLLLIACANTANLLLARAAARRREIAIRFSLGASRSQLLRQFLLEGLLLATLAGVAGLLLAVWLNGVIAGFTPPNAVMPIDTSIDGRVLLFTLAVSGLAGLLSALAPAWQATRRDLLPALKDGLAPTALAGRRWNLRSLLATAQVSLSVIVLIGASLCLRSTHELQSVDPGFEPSRVVIAELDGSLIGYSDAQARTFFETLLARVRALPGVEAAGLARNVTLGGSSTRISINRIEGYEPPTDQFINADFNVITPDYFRTVGMRLLRGRDFTESDNVAGALVMLVNDAFARRYWPGENPVGKRVHLPVFPGSRTAGGSLTYQTNEEEVREVIGLVQTAKYRSLTEPETPMMYFPVAQVQQARLSLHVRSAADPTRLVPSLRKLVEALDPNLPLHRVRTLLEQKNSSLFLQRMASSLLGGFGIVALLLAAMGIFGVMAYSVAQRTREIGIRMALGAHRREVLGLVLRQGGLLVVAGLVAGIVGALAASRLLQTFLFGISPLDPVAYGATLALLGAVGLLACWLPARRAARVDPLTALRHE